MALRFYFSQVVGTGTTADPYRPAIPSTINWAVDDMRQTQTGSGWLFVCADTDAAQHAALLLDSNIVHLPIEDTAGNPLLITDAIGEIDATKRNQIQTRMEARHVTFAGLGLQDPISKALSRIVRRIRQMRAMGADNWTEAHTATIGSIPTARRNRINNALQARGYDTSTITLATTIGEALRVLAEQDVAWQRNLWD